MKNQHPVLKEVFAWISAFAVVFGGLFTALSYANSNYVSKPEFSQYISGRDRLDAANLLQLQRIEGKLDKALEH
jgi:hypothetical protein